MTLENVGRHTISSWSPRNVNGNARMTQGPCRKRCRRALRRLRCRQRPEFAPPTQRATTMFASHSFRARQPRPSRRRRDRNATLRSDRAAAAAEADGADSGKGSRGNGVGARLPVPLATDDVAPPLQADSPAKPRRATSRTRATSRLNAWSRARRRGDPPARTGAMKRSRSARTSCAAANASCMAASYQDRTRSENWPAGPEKISSN